MGSLSTGYNIIRGANKINKRDITLSRWKAINKRTLFRIESDENTIHTGLITMPFLLFEEEVYKIVSKYDPRMPNRQISLLDVKNNISCLYYLPILPRVDCISPRCELSNANTKFVDTPIITYEKTADSEGNTRLSTMGSHEEMDDSVQERGNDFLAERDQARQEWWEQEQQRRKAKLQEELARREAYPDIYGCPDELEPFEREELFIPELYAVRDAKLRCTKDIHIRKLNLPKDHGIYITGEPMVHKLDCVPGDDENITTFGVCESPDIYLLKPRPPQ